MSILDIRFSIDLLRQSFRPCPTCGVTSEYLCTQTTIDPTSNRWRFNSTCIMCGHRRRDILMKPILGVL